MSKVFAQCKWVLRHPTDCSVSLARFALWCLDMARQHQHPSDAGPPYRLFEMLEKGFRLVKASRS